MKDLIIQGKTYSKPLMLAPMAGITNSPFRRLLTDFGGYDFLFTEMLAPKAVLHHMVDKNPFTKIRETEGKVIYQLMLNSTENLEEVITILASQNPFGVDLNLGCPAPAVRKKMCGARLFQEADTVDMILGKLRKVWQGPLSIKCRLGEKRGENWKPHFEKMVTIFEKHHIDFLTLHPRFRQDRLRRPVVHSSYKEITDLTDLPIISNGDIRCAEQIDSHYDTTAGAMLGRIAVVQPWIFKEFWEQTDYSYDLPEIWFRFLGYLREDFNNDDKVVGRIKQFTTYYAQNFLYGHGFYGKVQGSKSLSEIENHAKEFFAKEPVQKKSITSIMEL